MGDPDQTLQPAPGPDKQGQQQQQSAHQTEVGPIDRVADSTTGAGGPSANQPQPQRPQERELPLSQQQQRQLPTTDFHSGAPQDGGRGDGENLGEKETTRQQQEQEDQKGDNHQQQEAEENVETQEQQQQQQQEVDSAAKDAEALARAEALKREGNELFGKGLWTEAAAKYNEALDAAPQSAATEQAIYFANLAACNIKIQQYDYAVQNCTEAIRLNGSYLKAYMRRCEAFERLDELDHALGDAKALLQVEPENSWAKAKVAVLQPKVDERTEKLKTEMFSKLKDLGNTVLGKFGLSLDNFKFDKDPNSGGYSIRFEK
ncbi:hypothetical protein VOLCADRAFT_103594 [Volvox carteri f. nagariensis]|uniref:Uncharacterized protein n=1 Tax=Volvox carteri f. nagariensis TaxID=3068 RepID=D8TN13_VOLCA|nr:uncharacterized protein VOLCADRAFT_103594 [Volvox carteri f. nagariensis]EFJ51347.1 hypothetical protein VOLCADRAFT_103594 [Volvox carteri f. nagariensis]|eukprot:XP_002947814.1 hypothetical protein VOLCADRAFT_103594 [Volvox carteri f. nagariensis]